MASAQTPPQKDAVHTVSFITQEDGMVQKLLLQLAAKLDFVVVIADTPQYNGSHIPAGNHNHLLFFFLEKQLHPLTTSI